MNIFYKSSLALVLVATGLTSCSNEETPATMDAGQSVHMTVTVSRENMGQTRTEFSENNGNLDCRWNKDDILIVTDENGINKGNLTVKELKDGGVNAVFDGEIKGIVGNKAKLNYYYIGTKAEYKTDENRVYTADYSVQDGNFTSLPEKDLLSATAEIVISGGQSFVDNMELSRRISFAHFNLQFADGTTLSPDATVTVSGEGLNNAISIDTKNREASYTAGSVTITPAVADLYMVLLPSTKGFDLTFTVTDGDKTYNGTCKVNNPIGEGKYYRKALTDGTFAGLPVTMTAKEEEVIELDGTIFGLKWASANTKSYIDCSISDDDAWIFSYIPDITFAEQGLGGFKYITEESVEKDNNVVYHYQWDRDFGFAGSNYAYDEAITRLPNYINMPYSWKLTSYKYSTSMQTLENGHFNFEQFNYPSNYYDWCNTSGRLEWGNRIESLGISAAPEGFHIPTYAELQTLLPEGKNENYTPFGISIEVQDKDGIEGVAKPFFVKNLEDGSTVVWSILSTTAKNYLDIRRLPRTISKDLLNEETMKTDVYVRMPADGYRTNSGVVQWQQRGMYWAADCVSSTTNGKARCFSFTLNTDGTIRLSTGEQPRKYAFSIKCVYDK